jgi:2-haloacid dehalogenase/putative hydrolase of the HAD superfamily
LNGDGDEPRAAASLNPEHRMSNPPKYKALFLDFYGTVAGGDADTVEAVCAKVVAEYELPMTAADLVRTWGERFFATIERSNHDRFRTLYECECGSLVETMEPLRGRIDPTPYVDELTAYWCAPELQPEAREAITSVKVPICCVSNADTAHLHAAINRHGLDFTAVVTSEDARCYKPEPEIFRRALEVMGLAPGDVLHVGDSVHSDVGGAANAGIAAVWLCRERRIYDIGRPGENHKILSLRDLATLLE